MTLTPMTHRCQNSNIKWTKFHYDEECDRIIGMAYIPSKGNVAMMWDGTNGHALNRDLSVMTSGYDLVPISPEHVLMKRMYEVIDRVLDLEDDENSFNMDLAHDMRECLHDYKSWELKTKT